MTDEPTHTGPPTLRINVLPPEVIPTHEPTRPTRLDMPEFDAIKSDLERYWEELIANEFLDEAGKQAIREWIVAKANKAINIPVIGERLEALLLMLALKVIERVATHYGKEVIGDLLGKISG